MPIISDNYPMKGLFQCPRKDTAFSSNAPILLPSLQFSILNYQFSIN